VVKHTLTFWFSAGGASGVKSAVLIQPRRMALNLDASTLVIEYKEPITVSAPQQVCAWHFFFEKSKSCHSESENGAKILCNARCAPKQGKLRHRSFHIDAHRFRDIDSCVRKLSSKLTKVIRQKIIEPSCFSLFDPRPNSRLFPKWNQAVQARSAAMLDSLFNTAS
jgi:hypothetical protein